LFRINARFCLVLVALALAPVAGGASARAGYVAPELVFGNSVTGQSDSIAWLGLSPERPEQVVAGIPGSVEDDSQEFLDEDVALVFDPRQGGARVRQGTNRPVPANPGSRRISSRIDVVLLTDPTTPPSPAVRLSDLGDTLNVYHPCVRRLFRPPRPAGC
jgi:hypothetical protein